MGFRGRTWTPLKRETGLVGSREEQSAGLKWCQAPRMGPTILLTGRLRPWATRTEGWSGSGDQRDWWWRGWGCLRKRLCSWPAAATGVPQHRLAAPGKRSDPHRGRRAHGAGAGAAGRGVGQLRGGGHGGEAEATHRMRLLPGKVRGAETRRQNESGVDEGGKCSAVVVVAVVVVVVVVAALSLSSVSLPPRVPPRRVVVGGDEHARPGGRTAGTRGRASVISGGCSRRRGVCPCHVTRGEHFNADHEGGLRPRAHGLLGLCRASLAGPQLH